ncbi:Lsr2 dimerization domain-containing protein [Catellatospora paridis]|uniref:Lsr2 dimerization domain-containing protein n=1 Tax=Catellatospora paridis TaxID=1617086 RepID=UPI0012D4BA94|nr:histone-like nucleoid-structuring protein Lsr2 [Catellatospora paridis]
MARRSIVVTTDDIDGSDTDIRNTRFSYEGNGYQIDLSAANHDALAAALAPFIAAARRSLDRSGRGALPGSPAVRSDQAGFNRRVRDWSADQGQPVAERGRIPQAIVDAYLAAGVH